MNVLFAPCINEAGWHDLGRHPCTGRPCSSMAACIFTHLKEKPFLGVCLAAHACLQTLIVIAGGIAVPQCFCSASKLTFVGSTHQESYIQFLEHALSGSLDHILCTRRSSSTVLVACAGLAGEPAPALHRVGHAAASLGLQCGQQPAQPPQPPMHIKGLLPHRADAFGTDAQSTCHY